MKNGANRKKFKLRIKQSSLSEDEKRRLLFESFDILLASNQMRGRKAQDTNFNVDSISPKEYDNIVGK
jgi:hypothetical protein